MCNQDVRTGWQQLEVPVSRRHCPEVEALLEGAGALSVTLRDAGDAPVLEPGPGEAPLWPEVIVTGLFPVGTSLDALVQRLRGLLPDEPLAPRVQVLADQAWERAWMDRFHPMRFGRRLWVCPSHEAPPDEAGVVLRLDPGLAFGTGTHPTTALCLEWLDAHPPRDALVIDYGCGSGILAIAALKLGARHAWGVDIDPQALVASEANALANGIALRDFYLAEPDGLPPLEADLVLANILAGPLAELAPRLAGYLRPGGRLLLSGILEEQAAAVAAAYGPWFGLVPPQVREGWVCLEGRRNDRPA